MGSVNSRAWPQAFRLDGTAQEVSFTGSSATATNPVGDQTRYVRLLATQDCYVTTGVAPITATSANSTRLPADQPEYFKINPGESVAAVRVTVDGDLRIEEKTA